MVYPRKCYDCKKELTNKYWLITGIPLNREKASRANYCATCCDKKKNLPVVKEVYLKKGLTEIIEKEVGDKTEDQISEFEDKWEKHCNLGIKKNLTDNKTLLNSIQKARQEIEPYLQKPAIVEQAYEKKYGGSSLLAMHFLFLFSKSAGDKEYKQKIVQPKIEEILGVKLDEEISTNVNGRIPGFSPGRADGSLKSNNKIVGQFWWVYDDEDDFRCLMLTFAGIDNKLALKAFCRALQIKEKELKDEQIPEIPPNSPSPPQKDKNPSHRTLIVSLVIGVAIVLVAGLSFIFWKRKR